MPCPICGTTATRISLALSEARILECSTCHLLRTDPPVTGKYYQAAGDAAREEENQRQSKGSVILVGLRLLSQLGVKHILDVGAGTGIFVARAQEAGYDASGVEPSMWQAEWARAHGRDVRDRIADFSGSFDVVTMWDVLEHVPEPLPLLLEIRNVLRPDGFLVIKVPNGPYYLLKARLRSSAANAHMGLGEHVAHYSERTLRIALDRGGFQPLWVRGGPIEDVRPLSKRLKRAGTVALTGIGEVLGILLGPSLLALARSRSPR